MAMINMAFYLGAVQGPLLVKILLKRISLSREIFLMNIELGMETIIPKDLN